MATDWSDNTVIWDVETAEPLASFRGDVIDWSPDGSRIALSLNNELRIVSLPIESE